MQLMNFLTPVYNAMYPYYLRECPIKHLEFVTLCHTSFIFIHSFSLNEYIMKYADLFPLLDPYLFDNLMRYVNNLQNIELIETVSGVRPIFERSIRAHLTGSLIGELETAIANPSLDSSEYLDQYIEREMYHLEHILDFGRTQSLLEILITFEIEDLLIWMVVMVKFKISVASISTNMLRNIHMKLQDSRFENWELKKNATFNTMFGAVINYLRAVCILSQNNKVPSLILQCLLISFWFYNSEIWGVYVILVFLFLGLLSSIWNFWSREIHISWNLN